MGLRVLETPGDTDCCHQFLHILNDVAGSAQRDANQHTSIEAPSMDRAAEALKRWRPISRPTVRFALGWRLTATPQSRSAGRNRACRRIGGIGPGVRARTRGLAHRRRSWKPRDRQPPGGFSSERRKQRQPLPAPSQAGERRGDDAAGDARIRDRAIRRCGELLKQIEPATRCTSKDRRNGEPA